MPLTRSRSTNTADALTVAVRAFHKAHGTTEHIPLGWVSATQYAALVGEPIHRTQLFLARQEATGALAGKSFRALGRDGKVRRVKHYFIKSKKK